MKSDAFVFTDEQINYIVSNWGKESAHSMKNKFGCTWYSVVKVAQEKGLEAPNSNEWTDNQIKQLKELSNKYHYEKIADILEKSPNAVYLKARRLGIILIQDRRKWTHEEEQTLRELWGNHSINYVAAKLKRTVNSIKIRAYRIGLGPAIENTEYLTVSDIIDMLNVSRDRITTTWVNLGLKLERHKLSNEKWIYCITLENLIDFLRNNQNQWDSTNLEIYGLGLEYDWLVEKRKKDVKEKPFCYRKWTLKEKQRAVVLLKMKKSYQEIANELERSEKAVSYMLRKEGYSYQLKQFWKGHELKYLKDHYIDMDYSDIALHLGRTTKSVAAKAEEMGYCKRKNKK